jgi:hypothetical protein
MLMLLLVSGQSMGADPRVYHETETRVYLHESRNVVFRLGQKIQTEIIMCTKEEDARAFLKAYERKNEKAVFLEYVALVGTGLCQEGTIIATYKANLQQVGILFLYAIDTLEGERKFAITDIEAR